MELFNAKFTRKKTTERPDGWRFTCKGEYPPLKKLSDGGDYNPLVLVVFDHSDNYGHISKMYALDRWCPEIKEWEMYNDRNIIAWQPLPPPPRSE